MKSQLFACVLGLSVAWVQPVQSSEGVAITVDAETANAYVWRGQVLSQETVFQPSTTLEWGGISGNVWGNLDLSDGSNRETEFSEFDFAISYALSLGAAEFVVGAIEYAFPNAGLEDTREAFVEASLSLSSRTFVFLATFGDFGSAEGIYSQAGVGHEIELSQTAALALSAQTAWGGASYHAFYYDVDSQALGDANSRIDLRYAFANGVSVSTGLDYSWFWDGRIREAAQSLYGADSRIGLHVGFSKNWN